MAPHTRTRTGCWTCREAGYKCDEQKPECGRCNRLKITCKGYGVKLKWRNTNSASALAKRRNERNRKSVETLTALSPASTSSLVSVPSRLNCTSTSPTSHSYNTILAPTSLPDLVPDLSPGDKRLLYYWIEHLSPIISVSPRQGKASPFQLHLASMTCNRGALRSTVLSMAASHLALVLNDLSLRVQAYRHQRDAIQQLQKLILSPLESKTEFALATVLMMQVSARLFHDEDAEPQAANHLVGAKAMIAQRGGLSAWNTSSTARFLLSLFAYHDILSSVSRSTRPLLDHSAEFTSVEGVSSLNNIARVLQVVARISEMQHMAKAEATPPEYWNFPGSIDVMGSELRRQLTSLETCIPRSHGSNHTTDSADISLTAEAYVHAAFIYLYRVWLGIGAPNPTTLQHVQQCLTSIGQIDISSPLVSSHIWPLWTAGCEAVGEIQRQFVRDRFWAMYESRKFPTLRRIVRDIEDVWAAKDLEHTVGGQDGMTKVDCIQVILQRRGREVDLA